MPEYSSRVLQLTAEILEENASHYTVWFGLPGTDLRKYRTDCIKALAQPLADEWAWLNEMAQDNPKSYQIWHARRALMEQATTPMAELSFINSLLAEDSKNYHAWAYRQWVVSTFSLWDWELQDIERLIQEDVRNNSAWNQRFFVVNNRPSPVFDDSVLIGELEYALKWIDMAASNESPWNYLQGVLTLGSRSLQDFPKVVARIQAYADDQVRFALVAILNMKQDQGLANECAEVVPLFLIVDMRKAASD
ncbi:CAAX geranylgeranyltransferase alpha subunit [Kappamyces sp. JEL0680]|nr:CAAX geranylgeranyltransferase alpha subunit [Kappamyces sp. JEL0680]